MTDKAREENGASCFSFNNQEIKNFELMDSLYSAAADGNIDKFGQHAAVPLDQILTPYGNTVLHINITARRQSPRSRINQNMDFVREILALFPRSRINQYIEDFVREILEECPRINQNMDFVREILEMCPELLWKVNKKGETLLHMAARHGHDDVVEYLLQKCKTKPYHNHHHDQELGITARRRMLQTTSHEAKDKALHEAVRYDQLEVVRLLTKEDPSLPYDANKAEETPLYLAAERGYTEVVREILRTCISDHGPYSRTSMHGVYTTKIWSYWDNKTN